MPEPPVVSQIIIQIPHEAMSFEEIKNAIYEQAGAYAKLQRPFSKLRLGKDLYEILNRRLVFKTPAHKELPHFITPFGSLRVQNVTDGELEPDAFVIE